MISKQIYSQKGSQSNKELSFCSKMITNNSNMFAGDQAYKMTKFLNFQTKATETRYYSGMIKRTRLIRRFITFTTIFTLCLFCILKITKFLCIFILISFTLLTSFLQGRIHQRMLFFLIELGIIWSLSKLFFSYLMWIFILTLYDYVLNFYYLIKWYFNFVTHIIIFLLINYVNSEEIAIDKKYLFIVIILLSSSFLYGFNERIIKENWILFDTFKRSGRIYENIFNETLPTIILSMNGTILFANSSALHLLNISNISSSLTIKDYIYPNYLLTFFDSVNSAFLKRETIVTHILMTIIPNHSLEIQSERQTFDILQEIMKKDTRYCKLKISKYNWKGNKQSFHIKIKDYTYKYISQVMMDKELSIKKNISLIKYLRKIQNTYKICPRDANKIWNKIYKAKNIISYFAFYKSNFQISYFNIKEFLINLMDGCSENAFKRNTCLVLKLNPDDVNNVGHDFCLLNLVIYSFLSFIIKYSENSEIRFTANVMDVNSNKIIYNFKIGSSKFNLNKINNLEQFCQKSYDFKKLIIENLNSKNMKVIFSLKIIIEQFEGHFKVLSAKNNSIAIAIDIPLNRKIDYSNILPLTSEDHNLNKERKEYKWEKSQFSKSILDIANLKNQRGNKNLRNSITKEDFQKRQSVKLIISNQLKLNSEKEKSDCDIYQQMMKKRESCNEENKGQFLGISINKISKINPIINPNEIRDKDQNEGNNVLMTGGPITEEKKLISIGKINVDNLISIEEKDILDAKDLICEEFYQGELHSEDKVFRKRMVTQMKKFNTFVIPNFPQQSDRNICNIIKEEEEKINGNNNKIKGISNNEFSLQPNLIKLTQKNFTQDFQNLLKYTDMKNNGKKFTFLIKIVKKKSTMIDFSNPLVLIVEDNDYILNIISDSLRKRKICFDVATNGICGVDCFKKKIINENKLYSFILMDIVMPFKDGFEATKEIREFEIQENIEKTFICGMSSDNNNDLENKCKKAGMDDFVVKPITPMTLSELIEKGKQRHANQLHLAIQ